MIKEGAIEVRREGQVVDFEGMKQFLESLKQFIRSQLREGIDYGYIVNPKTGKPINQKPFLFKAGAEKLARLFNLTVEFELNRTEDWDRGLFVYHVVARAIDKSGKVVGVGYGIASSKEKKYRNHDPYELPNTLIKIAKKRAFVDAILTATASSSFFLQDEDIVEAAEGEVLITEPQRKYIFSIISRKGIPEEKAKEILKSVTGKDSTKDLTKEEASRYIDALRKYNPEEETREIVWDEEE